MMGRGCVESPFARSCYRLLAALLKQIIPKEKDKIFGFSLATIVQMALPPFHEGCGVT